MSDARFQFPQFFITAPQPCPYIDGQFERKLFTHLTGKHPVETNDRLSLIGFRRSQTIAYRPQCDACNACKSLRVVAPLFQPSRRFRKIISRNQDVAVAEKGPIATEEQFDLFERYVRFRHDQGGMDDMDDGDFAAMVEHTSVDTALVEYRLPDEDNLLIGTALCDRLADGWSMVYSFFDPEHGKRSLGTFMVLDRIMNAQTQGLPFVYLGFYVAECRKMAYKTDFAPYETLEESGWHLVTKP